jgi:hypothetical protein
MKTLTTSKLKDYTIHLRDYLSILDKSKELNLKLFGEVFWLDTIKAEPIKSDNFYYEYYSVVFNLACSYNLLGCFAFDINSEE